MEESHKPADRAKTSARAPLGEPANDPMDSVPLPRSRGPVRWNDPADARRWLARTREAVSDVVALAREGTRRLKHHVMSRAERRRQLREVEDLILGLFEDADAGIPKN